MSRWVIRIVIVLLAIAFVPLIINGVSDLVVAGIQGFSGSIHDLLKPLGMSGSRRVKAVLDLSLYVVFITLLAKVIIGRRR